MMRKRKKITIALVSHDNRKPNLAEWVNKNREELQQFKLIGTSGTAKQISKITGLKVKELGHGPTGGDIMIAHDILVGKINVLIFFVDTATAHGHEHYIQSLIEISITQKIPIALNDITADCVLRYLLNSLK